MPNRDKTGPEGKGPKTGREMGNCKGAKPQSGARRRFLGRRFSRGFRKNFKEQDSSKEEW